MHSAVVPADMICMVPAFLARRAYELEQLRQALAKNDFAVLRAIGERLYALGGLHGFDGITILGKRIRLGWMTRASVAPGEPPVRY